MKSKILIAVPMLLGLAISSRANPITGVGTTLGSSLGTNFFFNNASTGGTDAQVNEPASAVFARNFGVLNIGGSGSTINITGIAWASLASAAANDATSVSITITYLGADGVFGGGDDVVIGSATDTFTYAGAANVYAWTFTTPMSAAIDGLNNQFRITITPTNGSSGGSLSFKNTTLTTVGGNTKLSLAGTSTAIAPLADTDADGIPDIRETNTGIYVSVFDTGTNPADPDTDDDGYLDGVETNTNTFVSTSNTGTSPFDPDSDNDGLLDGVETNSGTYVSPSNTGTSPLNRDKDNDRLSDKYEVDNGLNPFLNADFDSDGFADALEVLFYGSNPKNNLSFPGDGTSPAPGSFTPILDTPSAGVVTPGSLDVPSTLVNAIINEAALGGNDSDYATGVTDFVLKYPNAFPAAGSTVSITGFAWPVSSGINASGDILLQFYDPGAGGVIDGIDQDVLVGTARGTLTVTGVTNISYWNFAPINFTSAGTGLMVKIQSTAALRIKQQDNISPADGQWYTNSGVSQFGSIRESLFSIGGTAVAPGGGPGPVDHFVISAIGSPQTIGTPITGITLTAQDASNATATGFTGTVTFGGTAGCTGTSGNFVAGVLNSVSVTPTSAGSNLTLTVNDGASHTGSATITTVQTQYEAWAGGSAFGTDANNDSVTNGAAWVLGAANPAANAIGLVPTFDNTTDPVYFIYTYRRADVANTAANTIIAVQYCGNLTGWITALAGPDIVITPTDNFYGVSPGIDKVEVKIKRTLAAGGKLFARLNLVQAP